MVTFNQAKLEQMILYIAMRYQDDDRFGTTRLMKVLFWAEFERFRQTGQAIAGAPYIKMQQGPMLDGQKDLLRGMVGRGLLDLRECPSGGKYPLQRPVALQQPDLRWFTPEELALLDRIIDEHWGETAGEVSDLSHTFFGWQAGRWQARIPYGSAWLSAPEPSQDDRRRALELAARLGRV